MKAEEKQTLYTFIKTTCDYLDGFYTPEDSLQFEDDTVSAFPAEVNNALKDVENITVESEPALPLIQAEVMVIAEKHGQQTDNRAEQLLDKMLAAIKLYKHKNCNILHIQKSDIDEINGYRERLKKQIEMASPKMILLMGQLSVYTLLDVSESISHIHGRIYDYNGISTIPTYHPLELLNNETLKRPAWEDLKIFKKNFDEINL